MLLAKYPKVRAMSSTGNKIEKQRESVAFRNFVPDKDENRGCETVFEHEAIAEY